MIQNSFNAASKSSEIAYVDKSQSETPQKSGHRKPIIVVFLAAKTTKKPRKGQKMIRAAVLLTILSMWAPGARAWSQTRQVASVASIAPIMEDPRDAFSAAQSSGKDLLLVFSGSDWCMPCIRFEKKILADSAFLHFAGERLVILVADFPQRKKIPPPLRAQYEALAEQYDPSGVFPEILLLGPDRRLLATLRYQDQSPGDFMHALREEQIKQ